MSKCLFDFCCDLWWKLWGWSAWSLWCPLCFCPAGSTWLSRGLSSELPPCQAKQHPQEWDKALPRVPHNDLLQAPGGPSEPLPHEFHETCLTGTFHFLKKDSKRCCDTTPPESIHTKDESKRGSAFAFIFGVN